MSETGRAAPPSLQRRLRALALRVLPYQALHVVRSAIAPFKYREPEVALVGVLARSDRTFLDVGAHKGVYVQAALGRFAEVVGAEPHPGMLAYLRACYGRQARIMGVALSDRRGSLPLHVPVTDGRIVPSRASLEGEANPGFRLETVNVPVERIDDLDLRPLQLVKIDVEGHELAVVAGAGERLRQDRPVLIIEIEERHHPGGSDGILTLLHEIGYETFYLRDKRLHALGGQRVADVQRVGLEKGVNGGRLSGYINNFVFLHREDGWSRDRLRGAGYLPS